MKFLVDAQLPVKLSRWLCDQGHDSVHTLELPDKNRTGDRMIAELADSEDRVVVTKDVDFTTLKLLTGRPSRILRVRTDNLSNSTLLQIFAVNLTLVEKLFDSFSIVEISKTIVVGGN